MKEIRKFTHLIVIFGVITRCVSPSSASLAASLAMNSIVCWQQSNARLTLRIENKPNFAAFSSLTC